MGTRADFYVGRGKDAEWLGSIAWDGYPPGITPLSDETEKRPAIFGGGVAHKDAEWPVGAHLFDAKTEAEFRERVARFFLYREDVTRPADGWPWPWETSSTTDYAYAFDGERVVASCFGSAWFDPKNEPEDVEELEGDRAVFPTFSKDRMAQPGDKRSGMMVIGL